MFTSTIPLILVDPDPGLQVLYRLLGQKAGFRRIYTTGRGDEALEHIRAYPNAVVLTELCLPRVDGLRMLETLEKERGLEEVRVAVLSNSPKLSQLRPRLETLGARAVLQKPFETARLVELLETLRETAELEASVEGSSTRARWVSPSEAAMFG